MSEIYAKRKFLLQSIDSIGLPTRVVTQLKLSNSHTVFEALSLTEDEFLRTPEIGKKSLRAFKEIIAPYGFRMGETKAFCNGFGNTSQNISECVDLFIGNTADNVSSVSLDDMGWIVPLLPVNLRTGLRSEFLDSAIGTQEFKDVIRPHIDAIQKAAVTEIHKALGFDKA